MFLKTLWSKILPQRWWLVLLLSALVIRVGWLGFAHLQNPQSGFDQFDSEIYRSISQTFNYTGTMGYSVEMSYGEELVYPIHNRVPGYPFLMSVFGKWPLLVLQVLASVGVVWLLLLIAERFRFSKKAMVILGGLMALDVPSILYSGSFMTESLFTFGLVGAIASLVLFRSNHRFWITGILLGLICYLRPIGLFLPVILVVYFLYKRHYWKQAILMVAVFGMVVSPWIIRNYSVFGRPFFSTVSTTNLLLYRAAGIESEKNQTSLHHTQSRIQIGGPMVVGDDGIVDLKRVPESLDWQKAKAWEIIKANPGIFLKQSAKGGLRMLFYPIRAPIDYQLGWARQNSSRLQSFEETKNQTSKLTWFLVVLQAATLMVLYVGLFIQLMKLKKRITIITLLLLIVGYFVLLSSGVEADARFRVPILPFLALLSAFGYHQFEGKHVYSHNN